MKEYDIAIVGGGGAGLTAGIYAARAKRRVVLFERLIAGGQIATTDIVENYPGFPEGVNGLELAQRFDEQARRFGVEMVSEDVDQISPSDDGAWLLETDAEQYRVAAVIVTAGADYNRLDIPGESEFVGKGVSYCATCDAAFFSNGDVIVVGGGDAALDEAEYVSRYARSVRIVHRRDQLRASALLQERAFANPKISFTWDTVVERIEGNGQVERAVLRNLKTGETSVVKTAGVFVFIGQTPNSGLLAGLVEMDAGGHAIVDLEMRTKLPGLFVAGDVRTAAARQLVSACGDGATAAIAAEHYLQGLSRDGALFAATAAL